MAKITKQSKCSIALTAVGAVGLILTSVLAVKCKEDYDEAIEQVDAESLSNGDKAWIAVKSFAPAIIAGAATETANITAQVIDIKEIIALTGLVSVGAAKYKSLVSYLKKHYPEQYKEAMDYINREHAEKELNEFRKKHPKNSDHRYLMREPITEQIFWSKLNPDALADKASIFINQSLNTDFIVSVFDYVDFLKKASGSKELECKPWMHRTGWCADSEILDYNLGFFKEGLLASVTTTTRDIGDDDAPMIVHSLEFEIGPDDFSDKEKEMYDIDIYDEAE